MSGKSGLSILFGLAGLATAVLYGAHKDLQSQRDTLLGSLAKGLHKEDYPQARSAMLGLARKFTYEPLVWKCLCEGLKDIGDRFGHSRMFPLIRAMKTETNNPRFAEALSEFDKIPNLVHEEGRARTEFVRTITDIMRKAGISESAIDGDDRIDVKITTDQLRDRLSPEQFLRHYGIGNRTPPMLALGQG